MRKWLVGVFFLCCAATAVGQDRVPGKTDATAFLRDIEELRAQLIDSGRDLLAAKDECRPDFKWNRIERGRDYISYRAEQFAGDEQRIEFEQPCDVERIQKAWPYNTAICPRIGTKLGSDLPGRPPACIVKARKQFEWVIVG